MRVMNSVKEILLGDMVRITGVKDEVMILIFF